MAKLIFIICYAATATEQNEKGFNEEFDGFKMILYLCGRHDGEFKYLIRGSEPRISK